MRTIEASSSKGFHVLKHLQTCQHAQNYHLNRTKGFAFARITRAVIATISA